VNKTVVSSELLNGIKDLLANDAGFLAAFNIPSAAKLAAAFNLNLKRGESIPAGGLIVPIKVEGAKTGDYVIVMHRKADGYWEVVGRGTLGADLTINATFTSFSPVMVLKVEAEDVASSGIRAPRTGED
jgi:hypothetical protein